MVDLMLPMRQQLPTSRALLSPGLALLTLKFRLLRKPMVERIVRPVVLEIPARMGEPNEKVIPWPPGNRLLRPKESSGARNGVGGRIARMVVSRSVALSTECATVNEMDVFRYLCYEEGLIGASLCAGPSLTKLANDVGTSTELLLLSVVVTGITPEVIVEVVLFEDLFEQNLGP